MTQADRVHSTPPTNTSADHQFLSTAAGIGGAVMTIERPMFPAGNRNLSEPFATPELVLRDAGAHRRRCRTRSGCPYRYDSERSELSVRVMRRPQCTPAPRWGRFFEFAVIRCRACWPWPRS